MRRVAALAITWVVLVSLTCGVLLSLIGPPASTWTLVIIGFIVATASWSAGTVSRTRALDMGQSKYAIHQARGSRSAVIVIVADVAVRVLIATVVLVVSIAPGALVMLTSEVGMAKALAASAAVTLVFATMCLVALSSSLIRIVVGAGVVARSGYSAEIVLRAVMTAGIAGTVAFVLGVVATRVDFSAYVDRVSSTAAPGHDVLGLFLSGAAATTAISAIIAARLIDSRCLASSFAELPSLVLEGTTQHTTATVEAWSQSDIIAAKEQSLVRRSRLNLQGGVDGLVSASSAMVGIVVGMSFSGIVESGTARIISLLFAMAIVVEFVSDGLKRINSADCDGMATSWVLISRRHYRQMIAHRARRHVRVLAFLVGAVGVIAVVGMSLSWASTMCIGVAGALMALSGTVGVVGFSARYPRWDFSSVDEIGGHPSAQGFQHALNGVLWMTIFVLAAVGSRAETSESTSVGESVFGALFQVVAVVSVAGVSVWLAPRACTAIAGRSAAL